MNKKTYLIEKAEKGLTIQQYLKQIAGFSNAQIRSMKFTENGICLGGQRVRVTTRLSEGDVLEYGGYKLKCILTPGHTPGHMCLYDSEKQQLRTSAVL